MTLEASRLLVVALGVIQLAAAWAALAGRRRWLGHAAWACPAGILLICSTRLGAGPAWAQLRGIEIAFLAGNLGCAVVALILLLQPAQAPGWAAWSLWWINSAFCAAMIYLTFFFSLF